MSNSIITKANLWKFEVDFLSEVQQAVLQDEEWLHQTRESENQEKEGRE